MGCTRTNSCDGYRFSPCSFQRLTGFSIALAQGLNLSGTSCWSISFFGLAPISHCQGRKKARQMPLPLSFMVRRTMDGTRSLEAVQWYRRYSLLSASLRKAPADRCHSAAASGFCRTSRPTIMAWCFSVQSQTFWWDFYLRNLSCSSHIIPSPEH